MTNPAPVAAASSAGPSLPAREGNLHRPTPKASPSLPPREGAKRNKEIFHTFHPRTLQSNPTAVAIGNFDGVHLGHRRLVERLIATARRRRLLPLVLTFEPHPERALGLSRAPMIQTVDERLASLCALRVTAAVVVRFGRWFASMPAADFVREVLGRTLNARVVVVGEGFRFGKGRRGTVETLKRLGRDEGIEVCTVPPVRRGGRVVSSSEIRRLLRDGDVETAAALLGRPYEIRGRVVRGHGRGRGLGFPTANVRTESEILPPGVFLSLVTAGRRSVPALTNVGTDPTFGRGPVGVESYLLGFRGSLYGRDVAVKLLRRLRPERKFASPEALKRRMEADLAEAERYFRRSPKRR